MNYKHFVLLLITTALAACSPTVPETDLNTAIAQAVETSVIAEPNATPTVDTNAINAELEAVQAQLDAANLVVTDQAAQLTAMGDELAKAHLALTPTITPIPVATATITPLPTATDTSLPEDQKFVITTRQTGLYTYTVKNNKGYPIMIKTDPIVRYEKGAWMIVHEALVQADGGSLFYQVVSPYGGGFYVDASHVRDR
jgi:hypothetical protein